MGAYESTAGTVVPHTDAAMDSKRCKTGADRSIDVADGECAEVHRLAAMLDSLVSGMTADRFGLSPEVAECCNAEQLREAINAWQALIAFELAEMQPP